MKKALITGITGQDGSYLAELLLGKGYEVHGIVRRTSTLNRNRIDHVSQKAKEEGKKLLLHYGDLTDSNSLIHIIEQSQPDEVYNLGAQSHVGISFNIPENTGNVTGLGTTRLLEALHTAKSNARFYQASSSELYGKVVETPQSETTPFHPRSPYACAKAYAFYITQNYRESYNMFAVNGILFNHESPRRGENFVTRKITLGIAHMLKEKSGCLLLGNLEAKRDWGYAPEFVEGMWKMLQAEKPDDYILATGKTHSVREFLEYCLTRAGYKWKKSGTGIDEVYKDDQDRTLVAIDSRYYRPADVEILLGDASKAERDLAWKAQTSLEELANIMLESDCKMLGIHL